jgi:quinolinate synthase
MNVDIENIDLKTKGYLDIKLSDNIHLPENIQQLKKQKNAFILGHYYQNPEIQDISDFVGDSLAMAQQAAKTDSDILMVAGVHFMAETAKIICPDKKVLIPDLKAGCSLADSCPPEEFRKFVEKYPDHTVISYVNTTAEIKALTDIVCTSSNAKQIVESLPQDEKIIFAPDRNLGDYINKMTGRNMVLWNGACHVHQEFSLERILELRKQHPDAKLISHPECHQSVLMISEHIGSTSSLLNFTINDDSKKYIVATESGIIHQMKKANPAKEFIPAPPEDSTCACSDCNFMKLHTLKKLYVCLEYEKPEVTLEKDLMKKAYKPIERMLEISEKLGL